MWHVETVSPPSGRRRWVHMGYEIKMPEVIGMRKAVMMAASSYSDGLSGVVPAVESFCATDGFEGQTADAVSSYVSEVHGILVASLGQAISELADRAAVYESGFAEIDGSDEAHISQDALEGAQNRITASMETFADKVSALSGILGSVSDLYPAAVPETGDVSNHYDASRQVMYNLDETAGSYEAAHLGDCANVNGILDSVLSVINFQAGGVINVNSYTAGKVYELDAFRTLAGAYENSRRYQKENVQVIEKAQENITAKIEAEAAAERAKKGFWDAVAAIGTMAIGAAAIICTGGAATPLVVAAGVSAMAYGASNLVEAGHDIYYGLNGDAATRAFNPVRDTLFMGNQTAYDIWGSASTAMSLGFAFAGAGAQASVAAGEANPLTISSMVGSVKTGATTFFKSGLVNMTKTGATAAAKTAVVGGTGAVVEKIVTPYTSEDFGRLSGILAASLTARKLYSGNNSSNAKKEINTGDQKVIEVRDAKTANQEWLDRGYDKPPYDPSYETRIVEAGNEHYVRTYTYNEDGTSNKLGGWLMREKDVAGLSSAEIADKYALPKTPTHICDVKVDSKAHLNAGIANSVEGWGTGGGLQYDTMGKRLPASNFTNERLIGK